MTASPCPDTSGLAIIHLTSHNRIYPFPSQDHWPPRIHRDALIRSVTKMLPPNYRLTMEVPQIPVRQQSFSAHPDLGGGSNGLVTASQTSRPAPRLVTSDLPLDFDGRSKSASSYIAPPSAHRNPFLPIRKRFSSISSLPPIPSASLDPMDWSWQGVSD